MFRHKQQVKHSSGCRPQHTTCELEPVWNETVVKPLSNTVLSACLDTHCGTSGWFPRTLCQMQEWKSQAKCDTGGGGSRRPDLNDRDLHTLWLLSPAGSAIMFECKRVHGFKMLNMRSKEKQRCHVVFDVRYVHVLFMAAPFMFYLPFHFLWCFWTFSSHFWCYNVSNVDTFRKVC